MSDIKLFQFSADDAHPLPSHTAPLEKELHNLMQKHMECFLGIRFVASEYSTGKNHGGRIDSLGLDENNCPVILEYKRQKNENVINQGLYYLDWLLDHRAEFKLLVLDRFGKEIADAIEWTGTRVLCIAGDFTKFDEHAVAQIGRNIELIRYKYFGDDLLMLEWINPAQTAPSSGASGQSLQPAFPTELVAADLPPSPKTRSSVADQLAGMSEEQRVLYDELCGFILS